MSSGIPSDILRESRGDDPNGAGRIIVRWTHFYPGLTCRFPFHQQPAGDKSISGKRPIFRQRNSLFDVASGQRLRLTKTRERRCSGGWNKTGDRQARSFIFGKKEGLGDGGAMSLAVYADGLPTLGFFKQIFPGSPCQIRASSSIMNLRKISPLFTHKKEEKQ